MIEKLDKHLASNINLCNMARNIMVADTAIEKINELVDAVNELQKNATISKMENVEPAENVQQVSYMAPGDITVFYGFNCSVEFDTPLPEGTRITIKTITKGDDNE